MLDSLTFSQKKASLQPADVLVVILPSHEPLGQPGFQDLDLALDGALSEHVAAQNTPIERLGPLAVPTLGRLPARILILCPIKQNGPETAAAALTEAVATGVREALTFKPVTVAVSAPLGADVAALSLGAVLGGYTFDRYLTEKNKLSEIILLLSRSATGADKQAMALGRKIADGVCLARDLVNEPPNVLFPQSFAERAQEVAKRNKLSCKVLDARGIEKAKMHLHHAVGRGSSNPPTFIHMTYQPKQPRGRLVFVGKGLTFDSGGLCIKPMQGMAEMKSDMAGGAAVLGLMESVAALGPSIEVHGIIGAAENMPDGNAYRPADVIGSLAGKTVEIINTDAEGRLVLADALTYAARLQPDLVIDAATLTGATLISLGPPYSAFFTASDEVAAAMQRAATRAGESFWRMPLIEELAQQLKSDVADLKHTGERYGGAITAALFLREFTMGVPWMHCDIPGAVLRDRASGMHPKGGTGHAVLTFLELVREHDKNRIVTPTPSHGAPRRARRSVRAAATVPAAPVHRRRRKTS